jgi:hypothetical protein
MTTPKQNIRLTADEWRARYAEIAPVYVGGNKHIPKPINRERVRQWEEFKWRVESQHGGRANIKAPSDPQAAGMALRAFMEGPE